MNHHYRIVWNRVTNTWVAVSELSKGHGKSAATRKRVLGAFATLGLSALSMASSALDLPAGAQVTAGAATVQTPAKGAMLVNQSTQRAVIKWNDFSIGQGKQVTFAQPNAGAATLNIVTGNSASTIAGTLTSNGSVYLINQNGIAITPTGLVDTRAGFIASTLRMDETAFMGGKNIFSGKGASVVNRGQIVTGPGGTVGLLGSTVANEGLISAPLGKVALGSGEAATLDLSGDGFLQLMLPASAVGADGQALVTNSGVIEADGGMVMLKASTVRQALREAVNMPGAISARSVSGKNGAIVLEGGPGGTVRATGALTADGNTVGGRIDVTGANVVLEGASLSATGTERGGLVRVGGAFQGGREQPADSANAALFAGRFGSTPALANATTTSIDAASNINVSATGAAGTGGTAIVWSDSTTGMQGAILARGAVSGGAVEVSAKSTVQSVALKRIDLGKGGNLLIDPQDIVIDSVAPGDAVGSYGYATPGTITHLLDADVTTLLSAGTTVSLQASQDISWLDNFSFVTRTPTTPGGDLNLSAGRSVTLGGIFNTADGNWNIVANDTAAHGVVDAERGAGAAEINVRNANFINSNGKLSLTLADGAGNTNHEANRITLGKFNGNGLTAAISPTATPASGTTRILLTDDINVSGTISLTGNLQAAPMSPLLSLSGQSVTWTDEKTGSSINGEGAIKFIENGVTTRLGQVSYDDAVRLALGDSPAVGLTRTYGGNDPSIADLLALTPQLHVAAHSATAVAPDSLGAILSANSLDVAGPGVVAAAGNNSMTLSATNTLAFSGGLSGGYFIDLTPTTLPLTITPRTVTPTVSAGAYIYGSPTAVASLAGVVNGDVLKPVATLNSTVGVTMAQNGSGFGFAETVAAGLSSFSLTGLSGAQASNYTLDLSGVTGSTLTITPKALGYVAGSGGQTYGSLGTMPSASLSGIVAGDNVAPVVALNAAGQAVSLVDRLPAGTYVSDVVSLTGNQAGNYVMATTGNTSGHYVVDPKPVSVTDNASPVLSTYGTQATLEAPTLTGILTGDMVTGTSGASLSGAPPVTLTPTTPAGAYLAVVTGLIGASSSNYVVTGGNTYGTLVISRKTLTYTGSDSSQVYGSLTLPSPTLNGLVGTENVSAVQRITRPPTWYLAGASGAYAVGNYLVDLDQLTGTSATNYTLAPSGNTPSQVAITPKPVTFSLASASSTYGTNAVLPTANLSGIVSGDVVAAGPVISIGNGAAALNANTAVGHYTLGIVELNGYGVANNYMLATSGNTTGTLTIEPKTLTWAVANGTGIYGNALTNATTLSGLVGGDSVASSITALDANGAVLARPAVGTYGVGVTSLTGPLASNYALAASGNIMGSVNIGPRPLTYTIAPTSSVYGTLAQDGAVVLSNLLPGDIVGAATVGYQVASTPVALTERSPVGSYTAQVNALTGANPNYVIDSTGNTKGVLTIAPKPVTFSTPNASSTYGTAAVLEAGTLSGVLAGDLVVPAATTLATGALPTGRSAAGSYALITPSLSGPQAGNYAIAATGSTSGTLDIAPKPLTYSLDVYWLQRILADTVTYGEVYRILLGWTGFEKINNLANSSGVVSTLSGVLARDDVSLQVNSPNLPVSTSSAYTAGTYRWTGGALSSPNYVLAATGNTDKTLTILPRPLHVYTVGNSQGSYDKYQVEYGSTAGAVPGVNLNLNDNLLGGLRNVDQVTAAAEYVTPQGNVDRLAERQAVGQYRVVMKGGLTGSDAANYIVTSTSEMPLSVTPKTVTIQLPNATVATYGPQTMVMPSISGVLSGDALAAIVSVCSTKSLACASGNGTIAARTAAGTYTIQATGLEGASAANYRFYAPQNGYTYSRAFLRINPKLLGVTADPASLSITYGDQITPPLVVTGVETGDVVQVIPKALRITAYQTSSDIKNVSNTLLDAGSYDYYGVTSGRDMGNYQIPASFGTITVAKRPLVAILPDRSTTYGTFLQAQPSLSNVVAGQTVTGVVSTFDSTDQAVTYSERTSAGHFTNRVTALSGATAANYVIDSASTGGKLDILQKTLTWEPVAAPTAVYGSAAKLGTLHGVEFNDDVGIKTAPGGAISQVRLDTDSSGGQYYGGPLDVGNYVFSTPAGALVGTKSGNYLLSISTAPNTLTVTPKALTYSVGDGGRTYGNYDVRGYWEAPPPLNQVSYFIYGNLVNDKFSNDNFTLGLLNARGAIVNMDSTTPVGNYQFVLAGLSGSLAKNYTIATTGNRAGHFTVSPMVLTYSTTSGIFLQGTGLVGTPGIATLRGPNGAPLNGDQVQGVVTSNVDNANLHEGRYFYAVTSLIGKDAGNYRLLNSSDYKESDWKWAGENLTWVGGNPYRKNDAGTLDVFSSNRFGQVFTTQITPPLPIVLPKLTFTDSSISINKDAISLAQPSSQVDVSVSASPTAVASSGSSANFTSAATLGRTSVGASVSASTGDQTSTDLGEADLTAKADASTSASAKAGPTGVKAEAEAGVETSVTVSIGSGTISTGAEVNVSTEASLGKDGAEVTAKSTADVNVQGGGSGSAGPVGDISGKGTVGATAGAEATGTATIKDGKVSTGVGTAVGVGVSANAQTGVSGSVGSANASATVYSPGSFGGKASVTGGYSDGKVSVALNLGAQLGFGGLDLNINLSIDTGAVWDGLATAGGAIGDTIGYGDDRFSKPPPPKPDDFWNDPVTHFAFLQASPNWGNYYQDKGGYNYTKTLNFVRAYQEMTSLLADLVQREAYRQNRLLELLRTDPKAAVDFAHSTDLNGSSFAGYKNLIQQADAMGVELGVTNGKLGFVKK